MSRSDAIATAGPPRDVVAIDGKFTALHPWRGWWDDLRLWLAVRIAPKSSIIIKGQHMEPLR